MSTSGKRVLTLDGEVVRDNLAEMISEKYRSWKDQRSQWEAEKNEIAQFIFQTDTTHTSSPNTPWKNRTTIPKICNIRDNLHSNYLTGLFPNDDWMRWEGYSEEDDTEEKVQAIQAYVFNKVRESNFIETASALLLDYIDKGNAFCDVVYVNENKIDPETGETIQGYVGAKLIRINPYDHVFDPTAVTYKESPKITRSMVSVGDLKQQVNMANDDSGWKQETVDLLLDIRNNVIGSANITGDDFNKANQYSIDGFGNLYEYYGSGSVEILEFEGSIYDPVKNEILDDMIITVADRSHVVRMESIPAWTRGGYKAKAGWRDKPDNLYSMGALDNLVGMQYRIDHLENAKADAWDLAVTPMFKIVGDVDEFEFKPNGEVHIGEGGDVTPLTKPTEALAANTEIQFLMSMMEEMAGAPKQAAGIRTPGEKTAFEVQTLDNAAGRIFQQKITKFEREIIEPALNAYLELGVHHIGSGDVVRVMDTDLGVADFQKITKEDITAKGKIRPIGARHFSQRAQLLQNLTQVSNSAIWQKIERHFSDSKLARLVEDNLNLTRFDLFADNAALFEKADSAKITNQLQQDVEVDAVTDVAPPEEGAPPQ